ncbi:MAG: RNA methyltransferase [Burkholderiales bacterium]|nr:RNA methyltransferase [Burkholderiales bacterium]
MERITSANNPTLKLARKLLRSSRERQRSNMILLDGVHLISEYALRFGLSDVVVLLDQGAVQTSEHHALTSCLPADAKVCEVVSTLFKTLSPVDTPTGIVALASRPAVEASGENLGFQLLLDGVQDPGNLGSILRTAAATGVDAVTLTSSCADPWSPKCLRGGMGAQFVLPLSRADDTMATVKKFVGRTIATSPHAGLSLMAADLSPPLIVMFGGEGAGLPAHLVSGADTTVHIPMQNNVESLNVAAAVAMICYERLRQATG